MTLTLLRGFNNKRFVLSESATYLLNYNKYLTTNPSEENDKNSKDKKISLASTSNTSTSITPASSTSSSSTKSFKSENVRQNLRGYVFTKYIDYVKNYDKVLDTKFPAAMHVYRVFMIGIKDFYNDMKQFLKIVRIVNNSSKGLRSLTRKEIELYHKMPRDMIKVAPVLLLSALPFANYVIFPLAYMYPRLLLTSHFWSIQQRSEFQQIYLKQRLDYHRKVFRCLQAKLINVKGSDEYVKWKYILGLLGSGLHPTHKEILDVKGLFTKSPYHLNSLSMKHINYLCAMNGLHRAFAKRYRLSERAYLIHHMDLGIRREGGVHNLSVDTLKNSCFLRGLNSTNLSTEKMIEWLEDWVEISLHVDGNNISLLLHLPMLIGYNHPNNWQLLHKS